MICDRIKTPVALFMKLIAQKHASNGTGIQFNPLAFMEMNKSNIADESMKEHKN